MSTTLITSSVASISPARFRHRVLALATLFAAGAFLADDASAQFTQRPGAYIGGPNVRFNPWNGSVHLPGQAVVKNSGTYRAIGGGIYQNPVTGNKYNPSTGAYLQGSRPGFSGVEGRPGGYNRNAFGIGHNPVTGSVHIPGQAVYKPSGRYEAIGGGHYRNPVTGNIYNPHARQYIRNW